MENSLIISCFSFLRFTFILLHFFILRFTFYIFCFLFCVLHSSAQQSNNSGEHNRSIDSLLTLLKSDRNDTNKVNHLCQLIRECELTGKFDEGLKYGYDALKLAVQLNFKKGIAVSYNSIGMMHDDKGDYEKALEFYLKSLKIKEKIGDKKGMAVSFNNIGLVHSNKNDYEK